MRILFELILLTFLCVMGLKIVMSEGMLLEKLGVYLKTKSESGKKWADLFICPWCMNSLQSLTAHAFAFGLGILPFEFHWSLLVRLPLVIMGSSFLSGNVWNIYETINRIKERNEVEYDFLESAKEAAEVFTENILSQEEEEEIYKHQHN